MLLSSIDYSSRIAALRSVGLSIGVPANLLPDNSAAISDVECLRWINLQRVAKSLPPLPGLDYHGFVGALNDLVTLGGSSVWSTSDAVANGMTLSNGGLTVTPKTGTPAYQSIRGSISKTSGKVYVEFANSVTTTASGVAVLGVASSGFNITTLLGGSNYSSGVGPAFGYLGASAGFSGLTVSALSPAYFYAGDVLMLAVDFNAGNYWVGLNNVWSDGNPLAGTGPTQSFVLATVGALFPAMSLFNPIAGNQSGIWTLQAATASQKYAPPSGFSAWDAVSSGLGTGFTLGVTPL